MTLTKEKCLLNEANGIEAWCTRDQCVFWRLLEAQDVPNLPGAEGCGLQHFGLVHSIDPETAGWLLDMKLRLENLSPRQARRRINFKRREE